MQITFKLARNSIYLHHFIAVLWLSWEIENMSLHCPWLVKQTPGVCPGVCDNAWLVIGRIRKCNPQLTKFNWKGTCNPGENLKIRKIIWKIDPKNEHVWSEIMQSDKWTWGVVLTNTAFLFCNWCATDLGKLSQVLFGNFYRISPLATSTTMLHTSLCCIRG